MFFKTVSFVFVVCVFLLAAQAPAFAEEKTSTLISAETVTCNVYTGHCISSYEPNTVGVTYDRHKEPFLDYKLSVMYPFFHSIDIWPLNRLFVAPDTHTLLVVNVRFAQFLDEHSAPVIGMRFNPKLVFRTMLDDTPEPDSNYLFYWEIAAGHESNGQSIDSPTGYDAHLAEVDGKKEFADDAISRGWDYFELRLGREHKRIEDTKIPMKYSVIGEVRYFLAHGMLEGHKEEYQSWENDPEGKPRIEVNGVKLTGSLEIDHTCFTGIYETGFHNVGRFNSFRAEVTQYIGPFPVMFWASRGYNANGDLAVYYRKFTSFGVALNLGSF